ncbi:acetoacetate--CoA ligase [Steroidobacter flavus]|uniref:Acetoacetate--CoA ligase n=1 Tax=Steroidobacter flavus TaxID=1842136 RepID=A0ABV8SWW7_9GAMM
MSTSVELAWEPTAERIASARITAFIAWLAERRGQRFDSYEALWQWSVEQQEDFWAAVWECFGVVAERGYDSILSDPSMPGARWFEGARLNFVDQVFRHRELGSPAIIFESEAGGRGEIGWPELERQVAAIARTLREFGVKPGDRVVAYLPNIPQTVIAFLAAASIGAIWSVASPELGPVSVVDRFRQIEPKVLIACDGYRFAGKPQDRREVLDSIVSQLPTVESIVWVPHLGSTALPPSTVSNRRVVDWAAACAGSGILETAALPSDHPLWILYSSGTSGLPKAIVHGHAGIVMTGLVAVAFHSDLRAGDRVLWTSSTSWMVWNAHVGCLLVGATLVLFDGAVTGIRDLPDWSVLWRLAEREQVSFFGAGAAFYHACLKAGLTPGEHTNLTALRTIASTGSPLSADGYRWLYGAVKRDVWVNCVSGGTDICGPFIGGLPTLPVYVGEMQCRVLGAAVHAFDEKGQAVTNAVGELVCTRPLPSMPLFFWGDQDNRRYLESYFDTFKGPADENVWRHGDWLELTPRPRAVGAVIYGRSDATINRQGIRMGTAELYRAVEAFPEVTDSLVVDLEYLGRESYMALFIVLRPDVALTDELDKRLRQSIRTALSPRHVPNDILQVPQVPKTLTGKKLELPIKKLLLGHPLEKVVARDALANPASLDWFVEFANKQSRL